MSDHPNKPEWTDAEYIIGIASYYKNLPGQQLAHHYERLLAIADSLESLSALRVSHERLKDALTYAESVMTYTEATVAPGNSGERQGEWVLVHAGRAGSSYRQLIAALNRVRGALKDAS